MGYISYCDSVQISVYFFGNLIIELKLGVVSIYKVSFVQLLEVDVKFGFELFGVQSKQGINLGQRLIFILWKFFFQRGIIFFDVGYFFYSVLWRRDWMSGY